MNPWEMDWSSGDMPAGGYAQRLLGDQPRATTYSPRRGGDQMEGGYESSRPGPDGQAMVRTLEDFRTGQAPYVTIAGNPSLYGRQYTIPQVSYRAGGKTHTLRDVPVVVHDTGSAFRNAPEGRFDVPVGRDLNNAETNQGLSGVQFMPRSQPMAFSGQQPRPAGVQAIDHAIRPVPGADPIPAPPWQDGTVQQMPAPPVGQQSAGELPWEMDWSGASPQQPRAAASGPMPWEMDWTGHEAGQHPAQPTPSGLWNNITAGANDMIYSTLGAPVDAATWLTNKAVQGINAATGADLPQARTDLPGSSQWLAGAGEAVGVNDPAKVQAGNTEERLARAAGAGIGGMVAPEAVVGALGKAGVLSEGVLNALAPIFGRSGSVGDVATAAGVGAAAGVGGQMAGDVLPEQYRPLGETVGNLLGGAAGAGAMAAGRGLTQAPQAWRDFRLADPATQERAAGQRLRQAATDPYAVRDALDQPTELVPGSQPTTFQATGDMGLGALERASSAQHPAEFNMRRADQNAARVGALEGIQPGGAPEQVVQALRRGLSDLDRITAQAEDAAATRARDTAARIGGEGAPEVYGTGIRQNVMDARNVAKEKERALWQIVDPKGDLNLPASGTRETARSIVNGLAKSAKPLDGEERAVIVAAMRYPDVIPFRELKELRSRVSDALTAELSTNGQSRVYARLSQLRGAIERDIENAVAAKAAMEEKAVQAGAMSEEDTMAAMLRRAQQDADAWKARQAANEAGRSDAVGAGNAGAASATFVPAGYGVQGASGGGPRVSAGNPGLQGDTGLFPDNLQPNFDEGAAGRLKAASAATKQRAQTFDEGRVGAVTRRSGAHGPFNLENSAVPARFFVPGPRGAEAMQSLRSASPQAMGQVRDYALATLRRDAMRMDGTLDPAKVQTWRRKYADALREIPEVDQMLSDPVQASEAFAQVAAQRKAQMDAFQEGAVSRLLGLEDPADVTKTIGGIFSRQDQVKQMARLVRETAGNEEARQGLRKAVADYVNTRFISNTEAGTSGVDQMRSDQFQQFLKQSAPALRLVLTEPELNLMRAIAADLKRANRSIVAVKLPGGSNTVQDAIGVGKARGGHNWLGRLLSTNALAGAGAAVGSSFGGGFGAALGAGLGNRASAAVQAMRQAGLNSVDDIVKDALLNPTHAKALLAKVSAEPTRREALTLAQVYARASLLPGSEADAPRAVPAAPVAAPAPAAPLPLGSPPGAPSLADRLMGAGQ